MPTCWAAKAPDIANLVVVETVVQADGRGQGALCHGPMLQEGASPLAFGHVAVVDVAIDPASHRGCGFVVDVG